MLSTESLEELSFVAKQEINENDANIPDDLAKLTAILAKTYPTLRLPPDFESFLLRSLRVRKFDLSRAAKLVSNYFTLMHRLSDIHKYLVPATNDMLTGPVVSVLRHRDSLGRQVVLLKYETVPLDGLDQFITSFMLMNDFVNQISIDTQRIGLVMILDFKGCGFAHFRVLSLKLGRIHAGVQSLQDSMPLRLKGLHVVRNPAPVSYLYALVRPFLTYKIRSRIHFHGHDFKSLHQHVCPEILPQYLGGAMADDDYADTEINSQLIARSDYYREVLNYGYTS